MKKTHPQKGHKQIFGERLADIMQKKGYVSKRSGTSGADAAALRDALNISYSMAHRYVNGDALPDKEMIAAIANWLEVEPSWLEYGLETTQAIYPVPILKWDANIFLDNKAWQKAYEDAEQHVRLHVPAKPDYFALVLEDNAWAPMFKKGTRVMFDRGQKPESDDLALILEPGKSPTFGILIKRLDRFYIRGLEEKIAPRELDPKTLLIGKFITADLMIST